MDVLKLLSGTGGTLTVAAGLSVLVVWLFRSLVLERRGRNEDAERWRAEIKRINTDHDQEIAEMRAKIKRMDEQIDRLNSRVDSEMELRRRAQFGEQQT